MAGAPAAVAAAAPVPYARVKARWLERWAGCVDRFSSDYLSAPTATRAMLMSVSQSVMDCGVVIGGLDLSKVYTESEFDAACVKAGSECIAGARSIISLASTYDLQAMNPGGGSARALTLRVRMGASIVGSSLR